MQVAPPRVSRAFLPIQNEHQVRHRRRSPCNRAWRSEVATGARASHEPGVKPDTPQQLGSGTLRERGAPLAPREALEIGWKITGVILTPGLLSRGAERVCPLGGKAVPLLGSLGFLTAPRLRVTAVLLVNLADVCATGAHPRCSPSPKKGPELTPETTLGGRTRPAWR